MLIVDDMAEPVREESSLMEDFPALLLALHDGCFD